MAAVLIAFGGVLLVARPGSEVLGWTTLLPVNDSYFACRLHVNDKDNPLQGQLGLDYFLFNRNWRTGSNAHRSFLLARPDSISMVADGNHGAGRGCRPLSDRQGVSLDGSNHACTL